MPSTTAAQDSIWREVEGLVTLRRSGRTEGEIASMDQVEMMTKTERRFMGGEEKKKMPKMERVEQRRNSIRREVKQEPMEITLDGTRPVNMRFDSSGSTTCLALNFTKLDILGKGDFGEVSVVECKTTGARFAMKIVKIRASQFKYQEVHSLQALPPHQNIIKLYRAWEEASLLYIQTELCEQSLGKYSEVHGGLTELEAWTYFVDMVQAVDHLHSEKMIHADIKPENVLLTKDFVAKLADFGLATDLKNPKYAHRSEEGDSRYLAPEVLNTRPTMAADIYSLGVTVLEVTTDLLITADSLKDLRDWKIPERILGRMDKNLRELVRVMMAKDPELRPKSKELMEHPEIKERIGKRNKEIERIEETNQEEEHLRRKSISISERVDIFKEIPTTPPAPDQKRRGAFMKTPGWGDLLTSPRTRPRVRHPFSAPGCLDPRVESKMVNKALSGLSISAQSSPLAAPMFDPEEGPSSPIITRKRQSTTTHTPVVDRQKLCIDIDVGEEDESRTTLRERRSARKPRGNLFE